MHLKGLREDYKVDRKTLTLRKRGAKEKEVPLNVMREKGELGSILQSCPAIIGRGAMASANTPKRVDIVMQDRKGENRQP